MKKVIILSLIASPCLILFWPVGIILYVIAIVMYNTEKKKTITLDIQINLIAKQLGIQYGTPEEKLEQIAYIAAMNQEQGRE